MAALAERLATVEQRLNDHEARCEERLAEIRAAAASTLKGVEALKTRAWGVMAALLAWALAQVWADHGGPPRPPTPSPPPLSSEFDPHPETSIRRPA